MLKKHLLPFLLLLFWIACKEQTPLVQSIDFDSYDLDPKKGITVKMQKAHSKKMDSIFEKSTINFALHNSSLTDENNLEYELYDLIDHEKSILLFGVSNCHFCRKSYFENFPSLIEDLKKSKVKAKLIFILIKGEYDIEKPERFEKYLAESKKYFEKTYIMEMADAEKNNVHAYPSQYYIGENNVIVKHSRGASLDGNLRKFNEITAFFESY